MGNASRHACARISARSSVMSRPQFPKQSTRPLSPRALAAAVRRFRKLCDLIEQYSDPQDIREKAQLSRAIHGLALASRSLSSRAQAQAAREAAKSRDSAGGGVRA